MRVADANRCGHISLSPAQQVAPLGHRCSSERWTSRSSVSRAAAPLGAQLAAAASASCGLTKCAPLRGLGRPTPRSAARPQHSTGSVLRVYDSEIVLDYSGGGCEIAAVLTLVSVG